MPPSGEKIAENQLLKIASDLHQVYHASGQFSIRRENDGAGA
jgi:hypothetical protein